MLKFDCESNSNSTHWLVIVDQTLNYTHWLVSDLLCYDFTQLLLPDLTELIPLPGVHVTLEGDEVIKEDSDHGK